jgi:hypothetical protein
MKNRFLGEWAPFATAAAVLPVASGVWLLAVPGMMSTMTFAAMSLISVGAGYVAFNTWRNGQPTENIGHVLQRTDALLSRSVNAPDPSDQPRTVR